MSRRDDFMSDEHRAEMEDRAAEQVERGLLLAGERTEREQAWADAAREAEMLADRAEFARREKERDDLDDRYRGRREYGDWRGGL